MITINTGFLCYIVGYVSWNIYYIFHITWTLKEVAKDDDKIFKSKKKEIFKKNLRSKLSLIVDVVKQDSGITNTGNVVHCFFDKLKL